MQFGPLISLTVIPFELAMLVFAELILLAARGIMLLVLRQTQRAEYLADRLAATVAGSRPMQSMLERMYLCDVVEMAAQRHALTTPDAPLQPSLLTACDEVTEHEKAALRDRSRSEKWQVDTTHPPTALRVAMLATGAAHPPMDLLSTEEKTAFDQEMVRLVMAHQHEVINRKIAAAFG